MVEAWTGKTCRSERPRAAPGADSLPGPLKKRRASLGTSGRLIPPLRQKQGSEGEEEVWRWVADNADKEQRTRGRRWMGGIHRVDDPGRASGCFNTKEACLFVCGEEPGGRGLDRAY